MSNRTDYKKRDHFIFIILGVLLAYWTYSIVFRQLPQTLSDYNGHVYVYLPLFAKDTWLEAWRTLPYFLWHAVVLLLNGLLHIPVEAAAAYSSCIFAFFAYYVMYWMIRKVLSATECGEETAKAAVIAFGLSIVQGLYCYWLDTNYNRFLGVYSFNPLHNPTHMCVQGFSLLCLCLVYDIWGRQKSDTYRGVFFRVEQGLKKYYILLALVLFLSVLAKPTFAEMFIPAVGLLMLVNWVAAIRRKDGSGSVYFKHCLNMFYCALPALGYILVEYLNYFVFEGSYGSDDASVIITECMQVWSFFSENIVLSIALGMAFPLYVVLLNPAFFIKNDMGRLACAGYAVGLLEAAFLGESEPKLYHADFIWPMMSGMLLMWITAVLRLIVLERTQADSGKKKILVDIGWFLFFLHALCGYLFIRNELLL